MNDGITHLDEFEALRGFSFCEAIESMDSDCSSIIILVFENDNNVRIEVDFVDGEYHIGEPFAIDDEGTSFKDFDKEITIIAKRKYQLIKE